MAYGMEVYVMNKFGVNVPVQYGTNPYNLMAMVGFRRPTSNPQSFAVTGVTAGTQIMVTTNQLLDESLYDQFKDDGNTRTSSVVVTDIVAYNGGVSFHWTTRPTRAFGQLLGYNIFVTRT